jgi:general secretion pathway protein E
LDAHAQTADTPDQGAPKKQRPRSLDLQTIFSWLLADGIVTKSRVKADFAQAQAIHKNAVGSMHPLTAVAQSKLISALPPHRQMTLDVLSEWAAARSACPSCASTR